MARILTCDTAIADVVIPIQNEALQSHWQDMNARFWGKEGTSKVTIDESARNGLVADLALINRLGNELIEKVRAGDRPALHTLLNQLKDKGAIDIQAGGTALNIVQTLARAFSPQQMQTTLLTALGTGPVGEVLKSSLQTGTGVDIITIRPEPSTAARTAMSLVYVQRHPDDPAKTTRSIAKYDGNFERIVSPHNTQASLEKPYDAVLLLGTLLQKNPPMFQALLDKATHDKTDLYFAMPTAKAITQKHHDTITDCLKHAKVVLSNAEEIGYYFGLDDKAPEADVKAHLPEFATLLPQDATAFITRGANGAWVIEKQSSNNYTLTEIPLWHRTAQLEPPKITNTVGAGDNAFAGFLMGHIAGHSAEHSAHMGMAMAHQRLTQGDIAQVDQPSLVYKNACQTLGIAPDNQHLALAIQSIRSLGTPTPEVAHAK